MNSKISFFVFSVMHVKLTDTFLTVKIKHADKKIITANKIAEKAIELGAAKNQL